MRFLIDRCAGRRLAEWLRQQGHDVVESRERGEDPGDRVLLAWAAAEARVLVRMDKDFGEFIYRERAPHTGIVRLLDVPVDDTERHLLYVACTRARDHLLVTGVAPASEFLKDLGEG